MSRPAYARWLAQTLILQVYVQARASRNELVGWHDKGMKIRLKAPPVDGEANKQLMRFLAKLFKVSVSDIKLIKGETHRHKTLSIKNPKILPDLLSGMKQ